MAFFCPQKKNPIAPSDQSEPPIFRRPLPPLPNEDQPQSAPKLIINCRICQEVHRADVPCASKPPEHPDRLYPACDICLGHHPPGYCYFDYLRANLYTPKPCARCKGLIHIGFCKGTLLCEKCGRRHNSSLACSFRELQDISNNICPNCKTIHIFHCSHELAQLDISVALWCNRCKLCHQFMKCTPFCQKCFRHHPENITCPPPSDFCKKCYVSHAGKRCPRELNHILSEPGLLDPNFCKISWISHDGYPCPRSPTSDQQPQPESTPGSSQQRSPPLIRPIPHRAICRDCRKHHQDRPCPLNPQNADASGNFTISGILKSPPIITRRIYRGAPKRNQTPLIPQPDPSTPSLDQSTPRRPVKRRTKGTTISLVTPPGIGPRTPPGTPPATPPPTNDILSQIYICPDDCGCANCKPVRFILTPDSGNQTPLPDFTERLI